MHPFSGTPHLFSETGSLTELELPHLARLAVSDPQGPPLSAPSTGVAGISSRPNFLHVSWGQNSAPSICTVTTTLMSSLSSP